MQNSFNLHFQDEAEDQYEREDWDRQYNYRGGLGGRGGRGGYGRGRGRGGGGSFAASSQNKATTKLHVRGVSMCIL